MDEYDQSEIFADDNSAALSGQTNQAAKADWEGSAEQDMGSDSGGNADRQEAAAEDIQPEAPVQTDRFELKHLDEVRTVSRDEVIALAQKGLDYDRIRAKYDALRADQPGSAGAELPDQEGQTPQTRPEQLSPPRDAAEEAGRQRSFLRFSLEFPQVKAEEIPVEIWHDFAAGKGDLADLFARHENRQLKAQLAAERQNQENRKKSTGSRATAGSAMSKLDADWYDGT